MTPVSRVQALAHLSTLLTRGSTLHLIMRGPSRRLNTLVDFVVLPSLHIGEYVGALTGRPYVYAHRGVLLKRGQHAEDLVDELSRELFDETQQFKTVWL